MHLGLGNSQKAKRFRKFVTRSSTKFDGTDDVITTNADSTLASKTYSFWAKSSDPNVRNPIFAHGDYTLGALLFSWNPSGNRGPILWLGVNNYYIWKDDECPEQRDGLWHHWLLFVDSTNVQNARLFCDGVEKTTHTSSVASPQAYTSGITLGRTEAHGSFLGSLDEFAIFDGDQSALADELYNNGQPTKIRTTPNLDHWFRMGEGKLDGKRDGDENLMFDQGPNGGLGSEKVTNGSFSADSDWSFTGSAEITGGVANWPNATNSSIFQNASLQLAGVTTYRLQYDVVSTNGSTGLRLDGGSSAFGTISIPSDTVGRKSVFLTSNGSQAFIIFNNSGAFVGSIDNVSLREVQNVGTINGPRIQADGGTELVKANAYASGSWSTANAAEFGSNFAKFTRPSSGGSTNAATSYLGGVNESITSAGLTVGATYKISVDVETDDSDVALRVWTGVEYIIATSGSGTKVLTFNAASATGALLRTTSDLSASKFVKLSNISLKEVTESVPKKTQNLPSAGSAKSMSFDGTDDFATIPYQLPGDTFTVSQWIKINDSSAGNAVYVWDSREEVTAVSANILLPLKSGTSKYKLRWWNNGTYRIADSTEHPTGLWQHVVLVKDGTTGTIYVDGEVLAVGLGFGANNTNGAAITVGRRYAEPFSFGKVDIDEFAIWDTALDGDAIKALYNAGEPTPVATNTGAYDIYRDNLKAYYKMGDATNPAQDGTSNFLFDQTNPELGSELFPTNSSASDWATLTNLTWDGSTLSVVDSSSTSVGTYSLSLPVGNTYLLSFDITNDGTGNLFARVGDGSNSIAQYSITSESYKVVHTVTSSGHNGSLMFITNGGFSGSVSNISIKEVNGNTGTITGATIQTEAPKQIYALPPVANTKSIILEGDDEFLQTQVDATLATRYYSFWAKATRTTDNPVFDHGDTTVGSFIFNQSSGKPLLYTSAGNFRYWNDTSAQDDGLWHHWTVYFDSADINNSKLWCDGVEQTVQATSAGTPSAYSTGIRIGRGGSVYFEGSIDEFSIHEDLDDEAIRALFNRGRPIDISKSQGAYDVSDKALHWWRMGDATSPAADGTNGIIFQGLEAESDELMTNGGFNTDSNWSKGSGWTINNGTAIHTGGGSYLSQDIMVAGRTYEMSFDIVSLTDPSSDFVQPYFNQSPALGLFRSVGRHTVVATAVQGTLGAALRATGDITVDNVSVKQLRGQYSGPELVKADGDLYKDSTWRSYNANVETFPNGTAVRFFVPASGGSSVGGYTKLSAAPAHEALTANMETGCVYKLQFDFLTDDSDAFPRYYDGSSYTALSSGSGTKVFYFVYSGSTNTRIQAAGVSNEKFVQFSGLSVTKVGGAAVMTNMTTSDIQTDTPY